MRSRWPESTTSTMVMLATSRSTSSKLSPGRATPASTARARNRSPLSWTAARPTLRDAHDRDYRVVVLADATADFHSDVHDFLIEKLFPREAQVITIAELPALLSADEA